jgi:Ca2+-binding EF-hand superfamily protein
MKNIALTLATLVGLAALPALAQDLPEIADTDSNGIWSLTEMQTAYPDLTEEVFLTLDTNQDGGIDTAELTTAIAAGTLVAQ